MSEQNSIRKLYDICTLHRGDHSGLIIMRMDDDHFDHAQTPWHREGFVIHIDKFCWEVIKERKYKEGRPDGFTYFLNNQSSESVSVETAIDLIQQKLDRNES